MYYKSVNRGMRMTATGNYTMALVFVLGLFAIASGYNGIYIAFSLGVSILIISGILSEKSMKNIEIDSIGDILAEPYAPFHINIRLKNCSIDQTLYGIETMLMTNLPKWGLFSEQFQPVANATCTSVSPNSKETMVGLGVGMARGYYEQFYVIQQTKYPFGLLTKFKLTDCKAKVVIPPALNEELYRSLIDEVQNRTSGKDIEKEFYCHRNYKNTDAPALVDWKKNAAKETKDWVVKQYETQEEDTAVLLDIDWSSWFRCDAIRYEQMLSIIRTFLQVLNEKNRKTYLRLINGKTLSSYELGTAYLAALPNHGQKKFKIHSTGEMLSEVKITKVFISPSGYEWEKKEIDVC